MRIFLNKNKYNPFILYLIMIVLGIIAGLSGIEWLQTFAQIVSDIFVKMFKCISVPIIGLSVIVTLSSYTSSSMNKVLKLTAFYTLMTTIIAASISCLLYLLIQPHNFNNVPTVIPSGHITHSSYGQYLSTLLPDNFLSPFLQNQVISVLILGIVIGTAIRFITDTEAKQTVTHFFKGMHSLFLIITKWIVFILPLGLFGFITTTVVQIHHGLNLKGLGEYLAVIVLANLIQGFIILPGWLKLNGLSPYKTMRKMLPALSLAFFSKSSTGTLPVTMATAEKNLKINPKISRFVLPLCTSINMNGCAAFIFTTVTYLMQNHGMPISISTMGLWIIIATIAAIGNAGVPMGCYFLSASLLASMNVPIVIMGIILPFYNIIDMIETALNVWSDSCVATVVDHKISLEDIKDFVPNIPEGNVNILPKFETQ